MACTCGSKLTSCLWSAWNGSARKTIFRQVGPQKHFVKESRVEFPLELHERSLVNRDALSVMKEWHEGGVRKHKACEWRTRRIPWFGLKWSRHTCCLQRMPVISGPGFPAAARQIYSLGMQ